MKTKIQKRKFGNSNFQVSQLGLGCMGMSEFYGNQSEEESIKVIHYAIDNGINFFDTADMYGPWTNEILLGKAIKGKRDQVIIATKFGVMRGEDGSYPGLNGKPEYVKQACEASLKRLGVDCIDLYYTVGAMAELVKEGKVKYIGLSEISEEEIRRAHAVHPITAVQNEYSLWSHELDPVMSVCRELNIAMVPYSPLGRGFLSGKYKSLDDFEEGDFRTVNPRFSKENFEINLKMVGKVEEIAKSKSVTSAQIALAWVMSKGNDIFPLTGTKRIKYLQENIESIDVQLEEEEIEQVNKPYNLVSGERY